MLWDEYIEKTFYKHICENDNFIYLNGKNVLYSKTAQIVLDYLNKDVSNIVKNIKKNFDQKKKRFQSKKNFNKKKTTAVKNKNGRGYYL